MEIINAVIENTNSPEVQNLLAKLNSSDEVLYTSESEDGKTLNVEYIEPINNVKILGNIPENIVSSVKEKYGENASIDIYDYVITYDNGVYGLVVDIEVDTVEDEKPVKQKRLPLPLLIIVGSITAILTVILVVLKLIFHKKK